MKRVLFLSFTKLIEPLRDGSISTQDLESGLFFFGATREHVLGTLPLKSDVNRCKSDGTCDYMHFAMYEWFFWNKKASYANTVQFAQKLRKAIRLAEKEGRIIWRQRNHPHNWPDLCTLLSRFDILIDSESVRNETYWYPNAVKILSPHIQVVG